MSVAPRTLLLFSTMPRLLRVVAVVAGVIVLVYGAGWVISRVGGMVSQVLTPVVLGVLVTALVMPAQLVLNHRLRIPRHVAAAMIVVGLVAAVSASFYLVAERFIVGIQGVGFSFQTVLVRAQEWLVEGPANLDRAQVATVVGQAQTWLTGRAPSLALGAFNVTSNAGTILVGILLSLVVTFFLLAEGDRIMSFILVVFEEPGRTTLRETIRRVWVTLSSWARSQVIVSAADAILIGAGAAVLQLPFVLPMSLVTFLLCFIPIFGAVVAGVIFAVVALLFQGPVTALIMVAIIVVVGQLEGNVFQPFLLGKAVSLHPLVVILGVTTATYLFGLTGALLSVPVLASANAGYKYWVGRDPFPGLATGKSAISDSHRVLAPEQDLPKLPHKIGTVTPAWLERHRTNTHPSPHNENPSGEQSITPAHL